MICTQIRLHCPVIPDRDQLELLKSWGEKYLLNYNRSKLSVSTYYYNYYFETALAKQAPVF